MVIGRVYKICTDEKYTDEIYIGSTLDILKNRFSGHVRQYNRWKNGKTNNVSSFDLFEKYQVENCHIELVKEYDVIDKNHLEVYETLWINKYRNKCVNQCVPFYIRKLTSKIHRLNNKEYYELISMYY